MMFKHETYAPGKRGHMAIQWNTERQCYFIGRYAVDGACRVVPEFLVVLSDTGDGGWSLHTRDDNATVIYSGTNRLNRDAQFLRPDVVDYNTARRRARQMHEDAES